MLQNFQDNETSFTEIVAILEECPFVSSYQRYPPFDTSAPCDSLFIAKLGDEKQAALDTLLNRIGCECVLLSSKNGSTYSQYDFTYHCDGMSIGPSIYKCYIYLVDRRDATETFQSRICYKDGSDSIFIADSDLNSYVDIAREDSEVFGAFLRRRINDNWLLSLDYDK